MALKKIQVIATDVGFDGMQLRAPGDVFSIMLDEKETTSKWFRPVGKEKAPKATPADNPGDDLA